MHRTLVISIALNTMFRQEIHAILRASSSLMPLPNTDLIRASAVRALERIAWKPAAASSHPAQSAVL
jgi:hypothetical protein